MFYFDVHVHGVQGENLGDMMDVPFHVSNSKADFCIAKASLSLLINCSIVERGEKVVKVEDFSSKDLVPLCIRDSSRGISGHFGNEPGPRDALCVDVQAFAGFRETGTIWI